MKIIFLCFFFMVFSMKIYSSKQQIQETSWLKFSETMTFAIPENEIKKDWRCVINLGNSNGQFIQTFAPNGQGFINHSEMIWIEFTSYLAAGDFPSSAKELYWETFINQPTSPPKRAWKIIKCEENELIYEWTALSSSALPFSDYKLPYSEIIKYVWTEKGCYRISHEIVGMEIDKQTKEAWLDFIKKARIIDAELVVYDMSSFFNELNQLSF